MPPTWTVKGERVVDAKLEGDGAATQIWKAFTEKVTASSKGEARWKVRRKLTYGDEVTKLDDSAPPTREREEVEIRDDREPRTKARTAKQQEEYERLRDTVQITSVAEAKQ